MIRKNSIKQKIAIGFLLVCFVMFLIPKINPAIGADYTEEEKAAIAEGEAFDAKLNETTKNFISAPVKKVAQKAIDIAVTPFNWILYAFLYVIFLFILIAGLILDWVANPENLRMTVGNEAIYQCWGMVRDLINIGFIFTLLFSALATIFQVESYNVRKIVTMLVIMALLVNFSFPIARFVIDIANSAFYTLLSSLFSNNGISSGLIGSSKIFSTLNPDTGTGVVLTIQLIMSIIFSYIFCMTLLIIAVMLVVRLATLSILVIFSPVGFAGFVIPGMKKFAGQWWDMLIKNSFFPAVMIFFMFLAVKMMAIMQEATGKDSAIQSAVSNLNPEVGSAGDYSTIIVTGINMVIPLVILWIGMMAAQQMGAVGAAKVTGKAQAWGMGLLKWSRKTLGKETGVTKRINKTMEGMKNKQNLREGKWAERLGVKGARLEAENAIISETAKNKGMADLSDDALHEIAQNGSKYEKAAAVRQLIKNKKAGQKDLESIRKSFSDPNDPIVKGIENSMMSLDPRSVFNLDNPITDANAKKARDEKVREALRDGTIDLKKVNIHSLGSDDLFEIGIEDNSISAKDLDDIANKSQAHKSALEGTLGRLSKKDTTPDDSKIHAFYTAVSGKIENDRINQKKRKKEDIDKFIEGLVKNSNKDTFSKCDANEITEEVAKEIIKSKHPGQIKEMASNIKKKDALKAFFNQVKKNGDEALKNTLRNDTSLGEAYKIIDPAPTPPPPAPIPVYLASNKNPVNNNQPKTRTRTSRANRAKIPMGRRQTGSRKRASQKNNNNNQPRP